jgi:hypothetical protein
MGSWAAAHSDGPDRRRKPTTSERGLSRSPPLDDLHLGSLNWLRRRTWWLAVRHPLRAPLGLVRGPIPPHREQDPGELAGKSHRSDRSAAPLGEPPRPVDHRMRGPHAAHRRPGGLDQHAAQLHGAALVIPVRRSRSELECSPGVRPRYDGCRSGIPRDQRDGRRDGSALGHEERGLVAVGASWTSPATSARPARWSGSPIDRLGPRDPRDVGRGRLAVLRALVDVGRLDLDREPDALDQLAPARRRRC